MNKFIPPSHLKCTSQIYDHFNYKCGCTSKKRWKEWRFFFRYAGILPTMRAILSCWELRIKNKPKSSTGNNSEK